MQDLTQSAVAKERVRILVRDGYDEEGHIPEL